jgi:hypothetical protein
MFLGFLGRFLLSFMVSNWIYSEAVLLCPSLDIFAKRVYQTAKIPTHDKWGEIASNPEAGEMDRGMQEGVRAAAPGLGESLANFFDEKVRAIWNAGGMSGIFSMTSAGDSRMFLSGEDIFSHRVAALGDVGKF